MWTDTYGELEDKRQIAKLKQEKFAEAKETEKSDDARKWRSFYTKARDQLVIECQLGVAVPRVKEVLRFHDHGKVEGKWAGKEVELDTPTSAIEARGMLWKVHSRYWILQTEVNRLKGWIDSQQKGTDGLAESCLDFVKNQREIDLCNQRRNYLIMMIDKFFVEEMNA
jgi:hypothetical protein